MPFKPGQPKPAGSGRKPGTGNHATVDVRGLAQAYTAQAIEVLAAIMRDETAPPAARRAAASELLDRGHGRPAQAMELTGADGGPVQTQAVDMGPQAALSLSERLQRLARRNEST